MGRLGVTLAVVRVARSRGGHGRTRTARVRLCEPVPRGRECGASKAVGAAGGWLWR